MNSTAASSQNTANHTWEWYTGVSVIIISLVAGCTIAGGGTVCAVLGSAGGASTIGAAA